MNIQEQMKWNRRPTWFVYFMHDLFFSLRPPEIIWGKEPLPKFRGAVGYTTLAIKGKITRKIRLLSICGSKEKDEIFYAQSLGRHHRKAQHGR